MSPSVGGAWLPGQTYTRLGTSTGPTPSVILTAASQLQASTSGTTYFLSASAEFATTLPLPALGLTYTFIVKAAPSGASYTVVTANGASILIGQQHSAAGDAGDTGTADTTITFVDGSAVAGDFCMVVSDGAKWYAYAFSAVAAGITFT